MIYKSTELGTVFFNTNKDPHGWIQFKGTNLCMDVHCKCGHLTHIDGDFIYFLKCVKCGQIYELNGHIELIPRNVDELDSDCQMYETVD